MLKLYPLLFAAGVGLCLFPLAGRGRLLEFWPYDKLMKSSDLVVIARAVKTEDCADRYMAHSWAHEFAGQDTVCDVVHTLKGKTDRKQIKVLHFKWGDLKKDVDPKSVDAFIIDGPLFVAFRTKNGPDYLLFLRALKDGRYEPVSGKIDPQLSVRVLTDPDRELPVEK
jgi:hypothetical protein